MSSGTCRCFGFTDPGRNLRKREIEPTFMPRSCHEFGRGVSLANGAWPAWLKIFWAPLKKTTLERSRRTSERGKKLVESARNEISRGTVGRSQVQLGNEEKYHSERGKKLVESARNEISRGQGAFPSATWERGKKLVESARNEISRGTGGVPKCNLGTRNEISRGTVGRSQVQLGNEGKMKFRGEQGVFPSATGARGKEKTAGVSLFTYKCVIT